MIPGMLERSVSLMTDPVLVGSTENKSGVAEEKYGFQFRREREHEGIHRDRSLVFLCQH